MVLNPSLVTAARYKEQKPKCQGGMCYYYSPEEMLLFLRTNPQISARALRRTFIGVLGKILWLQAKPSKNNWSNTTSNFWKRRIFHIQLSITDHQLSIINLYNGTVVHHQSNESEATEDTVRDQPSVKRCVVRRRVNCEVVVADLTGVDRLFQVVAAATVNARSDVLMDVCGFIRKPAPDDHSWRVGEYILNSS